MGFFKSFSSLVGSSISGKQSEKSIEELRAEHGFKHFDAYMKELQNYDPAAELEKAQAQEPSNRLAPQTKAERT